MLITLNLAAKADFSSTKSLVNKLKVNELKNIPADLNKSNNVVDSNIANAVKTAYGELVTKYNTKVKAIYTNKYCKTEHDSDKEDFETDIGGVENKILDISKLVATVKFNTNATEIENKIPNTSGLVEKTDIDSKLN